MSSDAHHITAPDKDGPRRILNALRNGGLNLDDIQYVNAHGTSTPLGDKNESEALKLAFGDHAKLVVSSTKSMTGHLLGAAGGSKPCSPRWPCTTRCRLPRSISSIRIRNAIWITAPTRRGK